MSDIASQFPDAVLEIVMEDRLRDGVEAIRVHANLGLKESLNAYRLIEEEMGFVERVDCAACQGTGRMRRRKEEFRRRLPSEPTAEQIAATNQA